MGTSVADPAVADAAAVATPSASPSVPQSGQVSPNGNASAAPAPQEITYDLKLPADLPAGVKELIDPDILTRTVAIARERGLTNEAGQSLLDFTIAEAKAVAEKANTAAAKAAEKAAEDAVTAANEAWVTANTPPKDGKPGGAEWVKRNEAWWAESLADPALGAGKKEQLSQAVEKANQAVARFEPGLKPFLEQTGFGSHPVVLRFLANVGRAMAEPNLALGGTGVIPKKSPEDLLYDHPTSQRAT